MSAHAILYIHKYMYMCTCRHITESFVPTSDIGLVRCSCAAFAVSVGCYLARTPRPVLVLVCDVIAGERVAVVIIEVIACYGVLQHSSTKIFVGLHKSVKNFTPQKIPLYTVEPL